MDGIDTIKNMDERNVFMEETAISAVTRSVVVNSQQSTQPESYHNIISDEQP
jgi:hypothetical protein